MNASKTPFNADAIRALIMEQIRANPAMYHGQISAWFDDIRNQSWVPTNLRELNMENHEEYLHVHAWYVERHGQSGIWGGLVDIQAFADWAGIAIDVYVPGSDVVRGVIHFRPNEESRFGPFPTDRVDPEGNVGRLLFVNWSHFDVLLLQTQSLDNNAEVSHPTLRMFHSFQPLFFPIFLTFLCIGLLFLSPYFFFF